MTVIRFSRGGAAQICGPGDEFKRIIKDVMLGQLCFYGGNLGVLSCRYNAGHARGYQHLAFARAEFGTFLLGRQNGLTTNQLFPAPGTTKSFVLYRKSAKKLMHNHQQVDLVPRTQLSVIYGSKSIGGWLVYYISCFVIR